MVPWYTKLHASGGKPFVPVPGLIPNEKTVGSSYYKLTLHVHLGLLENSVVHRTTLFHNVHNCCYFIFPLQTLSYLGNNSYKKIKHCVNISVSLKREIH